MGNVIFSNSFIQVADAQIYAISETTGYDKFNVMDRWHLKRRFRAGDANKSSTSITGEPLGTGDGVATTFNGTLLHSPVGYGSVVVHYTIGTIAYTATDDGAGTITGTDCSGSITYSTGAWSLTFTTAPDNATAITADYDHVSYLLKFDIGIGQTVAAIFLNDINFDKVRIRGHATDLGADWSAASFDSGVISVSKDDAVNRYKVYIPLTAFSYQWLAIQIPVTANAVGPYQTYWEVGTVCLMSDVTELSHNIAYGYQRSSTSPYTNINIAGANIERVSLNPNLKWRGSMDLNIRSLTEESEVWTMNQMAIAGPLLFYENAGDTSKAYLCARNTAYEGNRAFPGHVRGNVIELEELV